ncbi:MAG TPA: hypothetical protein PKL65_04825 [Bacteroidales bacterium]|jgi:hypothetical protein|nr:hypothetical protein [Bacteroidales bacterium]HPM18672.1 hypothetical protein [Bacteroidales bacterium]HQG78202.1 hypothetical protein [Bacteroidales bacterium]
MKRICTANPHKYEDLSCGSNPDLKTVFFRKVKIRSFQMIFTAIAATLTLTVQEAGSIPAFARKYQISCQVCHSPAMPRLKPFGDDFAGDGFRLTEYESPRYFIKTGDDMLSLFRELPVAIRMDGFVTYNFGNKGSVDFGSPFMLKILSGGELSDKLSYYFYFIFNERGSIAGVEDAFIMYHDLLNTGINLYLGQFQVSDPLFKGELRYTIEPYKIYSSAPGTSSADLKYDRGIVVEKDFSTGTTVVGQILNGSGIGEAGSGYLFDKDKYKNFMLRISQSVGKSISIGLFGYAGREVIENFLLGQATSNIRMFGPDLTIDLDEKLIVNCQFVRRTDSRVYTVEFPYTEKKDVVTSGAFAEVIFAPKGDMSKWYLTGLFNWVDSDFDALDYTSATLHAGYLLRRNMRVVGEFTQVMSGKNFGKVNVGVITAF